MGRLIPWQFWLIVLAALFAWPLGLNVREYLRVRSADREVTGPKLRSGPSPRRFWMSSLALLMLAALIVFLFSQASNSALQGIGSAVLGIRLLQILLGGAVVAIYIYEVVNGWLTGSVQLLMRGRTGPFKRSAQPKRFWASMAWNTFVSCIALWFLIHLGISE